MYSEELFNESKNYFPGGVNSPVRAFKPYPFFVKSAGGCKLTDVDGKSYIVTELGLDVGELIRIIRFSAAAEQCGGGAGKRACE